MGKSFCFWFEQAHYFCPSFILIFQLLLKAFLFQRNYQVGLSYDFLIVCLLPYYIMSPIFLLFFTGVSSLWIQNQSLGFFKGKQLLSFLMAHLHVMNQTIFFFQCSYPSSGLSINPLVHINTDITDFGCYSSLSLRLVFKIKLLCPYILLIRGNYIMFSSYRDCPRRNKTINTQEISVRPILWSYFRGGDKLHPS